MTNNNIPTGRFVWFELYTKELDKAQGFYGELFGWKTQTVPMAGPAGSYTLIVADGATIGGYLAPPPGAPTHSHWLSHLQVVNATETCAKIKAHGGKVGLEPMKVGDMGTFAVALDPGGAAFALWQPAKAEGDGNFKGKPGTPCWNELFTDAPEPCVAFYQAIGGFTVKSMAMPDGTYNVLEHDGAPRAGIMKTPMPGLPTQWVPYIQVANADQSAARGKKLGAKVAVEPTDIPDIGRFAQLIDPTGAMFAILQPAR